MSTADYRVPVLASDMARPHPKVMVPTAHLRFVEKHHESRTLRILQQWWTHRGPNGVVLADVVLGAGEWRDVPLVEG